MPYCDHRGNQLYYEVHGTGEPLFFIHSFLTSMELWREQIEHFSKSHRVIAMDIRGHGQSSVSGQHSLYDLVDDACAVLDAVGVQRALWCGLSIGGMISMRAACVCPHRVQGLALFATRAQSEALHLVVERTLLSFVARFIGRNPLADKVLKTNFGRTAMRTQPKLIAAWRDRFLGLHVPSMLNTLEALNTRDDVSGKLQSVEIPAIVVHGLEDRAVSPKSAHVNQRSIRGAQLVEMADAGHLISIEYPERTTQYIEDFINNRMPKRWA